MSQAENLLEMLADSGTKHTHPTADSDPYFVIDPNTRTMSNGSSEPIRIMQYDHDSEILTFELPRFVDGHDMMLCNRVLVHWNNVSEFTVEERAESTDIYDLRVNPKDKSTVICSWTVSRNSTQFSGNLSFLVQYKCEENGVTTYEWHTDIYSNVEIRSGRNNGEQSVLEYTDIIEQWRNRLFGVGDTVLADIDAATEAQKASIAVKGEEVLATIPEDYTETYNMAKSATRTRANAIVVTSEGESVIVTDSSDDNLRGLHVYGRTTQVKTIGSQLLNLPDVNGVTSAGITWSCNAGAVRATGTSTGTASTAGTIQYSILGKVGTFTISGSVDQISVYCSVTKNGNTAWYKDTTFTLDGTETQALVYCQVFSAGVSVNATVYPMVNVGSAALPWEPYSGGAISPSPEWPQELTSVVNTSVKIYGNNLVNPKSFDVGPNTSLTKSIDGYVFTLTGGSKYSYTSSNAHIDVNMFRGKTLFLKQDRQVSTNVDAKGGAQVTVTTATKTSYYALSDTVLSRTIYIPEDATGIAIGLYTNNTGSILSSDNTISIYGLMLSQVDSEWAPYDQIQTLDIPYTLPGVPVNSGGNYTDHNGQQWLCDEIDFERGVYIQRVYNGAVPTTGWKEERVSDTFCEYATYALPTSFMNGNVLSTHFRKSDDNRLVIGSNKHLYARFPISSGINTPDKALEFFALNEVHMVAVLLEPIETPLTEEELFAFSKLHSNATVTTAMNSENAYIGLVYNADTKTYFENTAASPERIQAAVDAWLTKHFSDAEGVSF